MPSLKCGQESPDVRYTKSRLISTFITINLIAAGLGLNSLAFTKNDNELTSELGRIALVDTLDLSGENIQTNKFGNVTLVDGLVQVTYDFLGNDACDTISQKDQLPISLDDCKKIRKATISWTGLCIFSILIAFVLFALLFRIECRKLVSKS